MSTNNNFSKPEAPSLDFFALMFVLLLAMASAGCGVEMRDKNSADAKPLEELVVEKEYTLPLGLVESEQVVMHLDRLVLKPGAKFITNGLNLKLEVGELISEDGTIATFAEDQKAAEGQRGRNGGNLELNVGRATGKLLLRMNGEHGGAGLRGPAPNESLRGATGPNGRDAIAVSIGHGAGYSTIPGTNGFQGNPGLKGITGNAGFVGGNSGTAYVRVSSREKFDLLLVKRPGKGGEGGQGGDGGPGGHGGSPGRRESDRAFIPGLTAGPDGPQGPQGDTGPRGTDGHAENVCVAFVGSPLDCQYKTLEELAFEKKSVGQNPIANK